MQIERFDLFREDIEDLVKLTVDKMATRIRSFKFMYFFSAVGHGFQKKRVGLSSLLCGVRGLSGLTKAVGLGLRSGLRVLLRGLCSRA